MKIQRQCLSCGYCAEEANSVPPGQLPLLNAPKRYLCLFGPPSSAAIPTPQGVIAITSYPSITKDTPSCSRYVENPSTLPGAANQG